jgi:hypothetical protein
LHGKPGEVPLVFKACFREGDELGEYEPLLSTATKHADSDRSGVFYWYGGELDWVLEVHYESPYVGVPARISRVAVLEAMK